MYRAETTGKLPTTCRRAQAWSSPVSPNGLAAISMAPALGWAQIDAYFGSCEFS